MRGLRHIQLVIMTAVFIAFCIPSDVGQTVGQSPMGAEAKSSDGFKDMLRRVDAAQLELQNGRPAAYKSLWSHADDITLSGGFGGTIEKGWEKVSRRLDWVGTQFSKGSNTIERLVANESDDLGYVVQVEHIRYFVPGQTQESRRDYRVTMVFRRESGVWRIIHRQADSQMTKQSQ
ncbi:MAG TPA: nuclear transport factor 2 family protein [Pyrinomonadaceae bacterium]|nr:nuclear transport factor 2 family protein [Pyrinomonadaceae bacterium]